MKAHLNIYTFTSLSIAIGLFFVSYQLRKEPMYQLKKTIESVFKSENLSSAYSPKYLNSVKQIYNLGQFQDSLSHPNPTIISDDSIFLISLQQIISASNNSYADFPIVILKKDTLIVHFHAKAKKNFDIVIKLVKEKGYFVFSEISNLHLLLYFHPEYRKAFTAE